VQQYYANGEIGVRTPPTTPLAEGLRTIAGGEFLYWIAREDGLEYDLLSSSLLFDNVMADISVKEPDFVWDPGFRVLLGWRLPRDFWELKATWSRFNTAASQTTEVPAGRGTLNNGVWVDTAGVVEGPNSTSIGSKWSLNYNQLDVGLSRGVFLGAHLSGEFSFGATGLWIGQKLSVAAPSYLPRIVQYTALAQGANLDVRFSNSFSAGGLFVSAKPEWHASSAWSVLSCVSGYVVHGRFDISQNWFVQQLNGDDLAIAKEFSRTRVGVQGSLGLKWQSSPIHKRWHYSLCAQYEGMIWFKQNLWSQVNSMFAENYERRGDLEMQGATFFARLDF